MHLYNRTSTDKGIVVLQVEPQSGQGLEVFKQLDRFKLRWFTPAIEVPLCGHATLASAAVLFQGEPC